MTGQINLSLSARSIGKWLLLIAATLTVLHITVMLLWFNDFLPFDDWWHIAFFDLDEEESIGTWFSTLILLAAGQLLLLQAHLERQKASSWTAWWLLLAVGFHILSLDEVIGIHEYVNTVFEDIPWTTFGAGVVLIVGLAYLPFLAALPANTRYLFVVAGAIYVGGAVGVERATDWYQVNDLLNTLEYNLWTAVEEFMEMTGVILFIYALMDYLGGQQKQAKVTITFQR
jgi:hypothetical protein